MSNPRKGRLLSQPTFAFPMVSSIVIIAAFLIYYFPITAQQESSLNNRAFRSLAAVSDQIQTRAIGYASVLEQATKDGGEAYLKQHVPDLVLKPKTTGECQPGTTSFRSQWDKEQHYLELTCGGWRAHVPFRSLVEGYLEGIPDELFDEVLLTTAAGEVLYQTVKTGNRFASIGTIPTQPSTVVDPAKVPGPSATVDFSKLSGSSSVQSVFLSGMHYQLYVVPVGMRPADAQNKTEKPTATHFVLCGLMPNDRFRAESMVVPGGALLVLVLTVLIAIAASAQYLKFRHMRATQLISRRTALNFFLTALLTVVLLSILVIHVRYIFEVEGVFKGNALEESLVKLSSAVEGNLERELRSALYVMNSLGDSNHFRQEVSPPLSEANNSVPCESSSAVTRRKKTQLLTLNGLRLSAYPYFDRVFWSDDTGAQHVKWDVGNQSTPPTNVSDRAYFQGIVKNDLWYFTDSGPSGLRFRVDPVFSRNTGEYTAIISRRVDVPICKDRTLIALSMVTPLLSLIDPVMPPDFGFAVIEEQGKVLFHSSSSKNGNENLFHEIQDDRSLRASIAAKQATFLTTQYLGYPHRMFVRPIRELQGAPWSLVIFHDLSARASQHLERVILFASLLFIYYVAFCIIVRLLPLPNYPPAWFWPNDENRHTYRQLTWCLLLISPFCYFLIFRLPTNALVIAAILSPLIAVCFTVLRLRPTSSWVRRSGFMLLLFLFAYQTAASDSRSQFILLTAILAGLSVPFVRSARPFMQRWLQRPNDSFTALCAVLLIFCGVLPSIALFKIAYDYHENLSTRRRQIYTIEALAKREQRIKERYRDITIAAADEEAHWLFLRRRLDEGLDRYNSEYLSAENTGLILSPRPDGKQALLDNITPEPDVLPEPLVRLASLIPSARGTLTRNLTNSSSEDSVWSWSRVGTTNRIRLRRSNSFIIRDSVPAFDEEFVYTSAEARALKQSLTDNPVFLSPDLISELTLLETWRWGFAAVLLCSAVAFFWIGPTIRRMFFVDFVPGEPFPVVGVDEALEHQNVILLVTDYSEADRIRALQNALVIDLAAQAPEAIEKMDQPIVVLDHFDYRIGDAEVQTKKLEIIERLRFHHASKKIIVISSIDPLFYFSGNAELLGRDHQGQNAGQQMDRWMGALVPFQRLQAAPQQSCLSLSYAVQLWSTCTTRERLALYQLAREGWVNPHNDAALHQLQRREILQPGLPFRFKDPAFREFVLRAISPESQKQWVNQDSVSVWDGIRAMFLVILAGVLGAVLLVYQQSFLGIALAGMGMLTTLGRLITEARGIRSLLGVGGSDNE